MEITLIELEQAINYWRMRCPSSGEAHCLSPEVNTLATIYALMIFDKRKTLSLESMDKAALDLLEIWRQQHR